MGKGNALPPASRGVICNIDVGGAAPIAQRVRPVAPNVSWKVGGPDQRVTIGKNHMSLNFAMGVADRSDREKEWGRYTTVYRLPKS